MAAPKFLNGIDMVKTQLNNAVIQNLASAPGSPVEGLIYHDTTLHQFGYYNGTSWVYPGSGGGDMVLASVQTITGAKTFGTIGGAVGKFILAGSTSGSTIVNAAAVAGSGTMTLPTGTDTLAGLATAQTWTGVQTFGAAGNVGKLAIAGTTSGSTVLNAAATASGTLTLPAATDTLVGKATTDTFTNKTFDAAGTGNALSNIATSMFAVNVIDTDGTLAANSNTRIASQAAVVTYVNTNIQGVRWKAPVRAATTTNGTLATAYQNGSVIDGVTLATNDRILLKDQTTGQDNGIYTVNASGAPTRAVDADTAAEVLQFVVSVSEGTVNADKSFVNTTNAAITLGTTPLVITDFVTSNVPTATTAVAGKVFLATQAEAEAKSDTAKAVVSADLVNFPIKKLFTIGDGTTTAIVVTHSLGNKDVIVQVRDASTDAVVYPDITNTSTTTCTITFAVAPATNAYKVVVIG